MLENSVSAYTSNTELHIVPCDILACIQLNMTGITTYMYGDDQEKTV